MSKWMKFAALTASTLILTSVAHAQVVVSEPWVRATVTQQTGTGAFMTLTSEKNATLVAAESNVAEHVEVHEMAMENNVMKMRQVSGLLLPAGQSVELKPGGYHIMFINLHQQLKEGQQVPITLVFESEDGQRSTLEVLAPVKPLAAASGGHAHGAGHGGHAPKH